MSAARFVALAALLALCAPCCTPASLPRWAAPSITVPGNIADRYKLQLLALRHLTKQLEGRPIHAQLSAWTDVYAARLHEKLQPGGLEPVLEALAGAVRADPLGDILGPLFAQLPAVPDPLLLGARDIDGGKYGEGPHGQAGGVDVSATVARFGPCVFEGGSEGAGAYAHGVRVAPTGLALGATGAKVAPTLIDVSPGLIDISATGADVSPAEISVAPALMRIAPGFVSARPGTVQDMLAGVGKGIARAVGLSGAAAPPPS